MPQNENFTIRVGQGSYGPQFQLSRNEKGNWSYQLISVGYEGYSPTDITFVVRTILALEIAYSEERDGTGKAQRMD